jgi:hypothetical protein
MEHAPHDAERWKAEMEDWQAGESYSLLGV